MMMCQVLICRRTFAGYIKAVKDNKSELGMVCSQKNCERDGLVYTFKPCTLKWSDRHPSTSGDFVYTYRKLVNPKRHVACNQRMEVPKMRAPVRELGVEELGC